VEQLVGIDFGAVGHGLGKVGQPDQQKQYEGDGSQQRVEGQRTGQKWNVVFIGGLEGPAEKAGG
jgi:hypothetical protein